MKQYIYRPENFSSSENFGSKKTFKTKLSDGKENQVSAFSPKSFEKYRLECKKQGKSFTLLGKTKLKPLKKGSDGKTRTTKNSDAVFSMSSTEHFEVRNKYPFSRTTGYIPVGENQFIEVVKFNPVVIIIAALIICAFISLAIMISIRIEEGNRSNPYLVPTDIPETNAAGSGSTQYILDTTLNIVKVDGKYTIQGLNFNNINEGKYLVEKIKLHETDRNYIYTSEKVPFGQKIEADYLDIQSEIEPGTYETIAEVYVYSADDNSLVTQANFVTTLIVN